MCALAVLFYVVVSVSVSMCCFLCKRMYVCVGVGPLFKFFTIKDIVEIEICSKRKQALKKLFRFGNCKNADIYLTTYSTATSHLRYTPS